MKTIILSLVVLSFFGCKVKPIAPPITLLRSFKINDTWDSIYVYSDGHTVYKQKEPKTIEQPQRYFLISYKYRSKKDDADGEARSAGLT